MNIRKQFSLSRFNDHILQLIFFLDKYMILKTELGTFEWWISELMLDPLFFLISRLNNACSLLYINFQINLLIGIKDIPF